MTFTDKMVPAFLEPQTAAIKRFSKYKGEADETVRQQDARAAGNVGKILGLWAEWAHSKLRSYQGYQEWEAEVAIQSAESGITPQDIEAFSRMLQEFKDCPGFNQKAGLFLSSLMRGCGEAEYSIYTAARKRMHCLGSRITAGTVTVRGHLGHDTGYEMFGGKLIVEGNVESGAGYFMHGGEIIVRGNAKDGTGVAMSGGRITIEGDAGAGVGGGMKGGEIFLMGQYAGLGHDSSMRGRIYHKGRLVFTR